ncbi:hypothetical protein NBG84_35650 [Streptomyces sp. CWNU-1]|uniref:ABC transporter domain-containing protein n=1 Tax=Streptomyces albipurpureus TaxID=2897419 RepID=A0ABT0V2D7_9ACTN|nr:hypothetical protein [Streptomyces sp. CWNU-1]MCM2393551.1 hypothetical protein [Streptomyces sp. CWNU-1]
MHAFIGPNGAGKSTTFSVLSAPSVRRTGSSLWVWHRQLDAGRHTFTCAAFTASTLCDGRAPSASRGAHSERVREVDEFTGLRPVSALRSRSSTASASSWPGACTWSPNSCC